MKRTTILILLFTLIASNSAGQVKTDRFFVSPTQSYHRGEDYFHYLVESFQYEGSLEGKRWWTDYYAPRYRYTTNKRKQAKAEKEKEAYDKKQEEMKKVYPYHRILFFVNPSCNAPYGFSYSPQDTALVYLRIKKMAPTMEKTVVTATKMKVDVAVYDSIQTLHMLTVYTAVPMDPTFTQLDGERYHFVWGDWLGNRYAQSHDSETSTGKKLQGTFRDICISISNNDCERLSALMPTVHELLAHYRTLLLPDVPVDGWELDMYRRKTKKL